MVLQNIQTDGAILAAYVGVPGRKNSFARTGTIIVLHSSTRTSPENNVGSTLLTKLNDLSSDNPKPECTDVRLSCAVAHTKLWSRTASSVAQKDKQLFGLAANTLSLQNVSNENKNKNKDCERWSNSTVT